MGSTQFTSKGSGQVRGVGRFPGCLPLALVTVAGLCALGVGPRCSRGSQLDEPPRSPEQPAAGKAGPGPQTSPKAKRSDAPAARTQGQLALRSNDSTRGGLPADTAVATPSIPSSDGSPIARALKEIAECQAKYRTIADYTCTFYKRERLDGRLTGLHVMTMKVRRDPGSIYIKFQQPGAGREAIYIAGRNGGKLLAHDVGLNKLLAGTLLLEPTSARAMEDNRHPITDAGIGPLLDTLSTRWALELDPEEAVVTFRDDALVGKRHCRLIEVTHPHRRHRFLHHKVRVYIDKGLGVPIRFEAYDWPKKPDSPSNLIEEYTYMDLKLNVGLRDIDFDTANPDYSFGRF